MYGHAASLGYDFIPEGSSRIQTHLRLPKLACSSHDGTALLFDGLGEQEGKIKDMDYTNLFNSLESVIRGSIFSPVTARVASRN